MYGRNNFNSNLGQGQMQGGNFQRANGIQLEITGWNNATISDFSSFMYRKTKIQLMNAHNQGNILYANVKNDRDANDAVRCTGMKFAGQTLNIKRTSNTTNNTTTSSGQKGQGVMITALKGILSTRYNMATKMLDLTNLINEPSVIQNKFMSTNAMGTKFFAALLTIAKKENLVIESVNLSMNNLDNHSNWVHELGLLFPNVRNLALGNNKITKPVIFNNVKNKFTMIREIILQGNPICQDPESLNKIVTMFPRLVIIDSTQVRDEQKLHTILNFPVATKQTFFENGDLQSASTDFVKSFLSCWDNNRMDLMGLYTPQTQFSYQMDTTSVSDSTSINTGSNSWNNYIPNSRNLKKVSQEKSRMQRLFVGNEQISKAFMSLPGTEHSPDLAMETMMYPQINGMMITIHGQLQEKSQPQIQGEKRRGVKGELQQRSFDRTWVIVPGGSSGLLVVSDLLMLRNFCGNKGWNVPQQVPQVSQISQQAPHGTPITPVASAGSVPQQPLSTSSPVGGFPNQTPMQSEMAMKVQKETNLKPEFVVMLLEQSNWDYATAGRNFVANRANIPSDAFQ